MHLAEDTDETSGACNARGELAPGARAPPGGGEDGAPPETAAPGADAGPRLEYLTFRLAPQDFALAIREVREVLRCPPITEVPRAPADVLGVVTVRGEIIAIVDPRRRLGLSQPPPGPGRLVVVDAGDGPCGLLVDAIAGVVRVRPGSLEPAGAGAPACVAGVGRDRARAFAVIDLAALLGAPEPARG
jgi:purine-binding chemotaxis protein CheW